MIASAGQVVKSLKHTKNLHLLRKNTMPNTMPNTTKSITANYDDLNSGGDFIESVQVRPYGQNMLVADPVEVNGEFRRVVGMAITAENAEKCGFTAADESWELIEYRFQGGDTLPLFVSASPRLCILKIGDIHMKARNQKDSFPEKMNQAKWKYYQENKDSHQLLQRYAIAFLDAKNNICQDTPLMLTFKGVLCAQMGAYFGSFARKIEKKKDQQIAFCDLLRGYATERKISVTSTGFFSKFSFAPQYKIEVRGSGSASKKLYCMTGYHAGSFESLLLPPESRVKINEMLEQVSSWDLNWSKAEKSEESEATEEGIDYVRRSQAIAADSAGLDDFESQGYEMLY
jgi:hypothetical protein